MILKLYNTLTRKKEIFKPIKKSMVGLYCCGPTVYQNAHIGNMRAYIFEDILKRTLIYNKYKVKHVMNVTDVGHLTSDEDSGQDKMDLAVKREKKTPKQIAASYSKAFFDDLKKLNILPTNIKPIGTENIKDMIKVIKRIEKNGYTYQGKNGNVYFDTSKFKDYGKLARLKLDQQKAGARTEIDPNKKHPRDFVLWFSTTGSKFKGHLQNWDSPWGKGWPGWHIECSAMSMKYLGEQFDIHCGGLDHIPVHHPNEIAQSESATGKKWVNYWLHNEWLIIEGQKMSKSLGNFYTLDDLIKKGYDPVSIRYTFLKTHYRQSINLTFDSLKASQNALKRIQNFVSSIKEASKKDNTSLNKLCKKAEANFEKEINDDLNTPKALAVLFNFTKEVNKLQLSKKDIKKTINLISKFDQVLGLDLTKIKKEKIPQKVVDLAKKREKARKNKDFKLADSIRDQVNKQGYSIEDSESGFKVKKL
jgi:cysteinyl-tRNA synthetase